MRAGVKPNVQAASTSQATQTATRRAVLLGSMLTAGLTLIPAQANAYGGRGTLTAVDAGTGNPRYDELMKQLEAKGVKLPEAPKSSPKGDASATATSQQTPSRKIN